MVKQEQYVGQLGGSLREAASFSGNEQVTAKFEDNLWTPLTFPIFQELATSLEDMTYYELYGQIGDENDE